MIDKETRASFQAMAAFGGGDPAALTVGLRRETTGLGLRSLAARALYVATQAPERLAYVYDRAAAGWLSEAMPIQRAPRAALPPSTPLPPRFWFTFWSLVEAPVQLHRRLAFTAQAAYLAGLLPPELILRIAKAALGFPGVDEAAAGAPPERIPLGRLARCPPGSLGGEVYLEVLSRRAELEILDRADLGLHLLPAPLDYVNARILQSHGLWRIAAGYGPSALDEIGMAAFQMAQFGHHHSALVTAIVLATAAFRREAHLGFVLDTVFMGWAHGRRSPPLLGVDWESVWDRPAPEVRARLGLTARSPDYDPLAVAAVLPGAH